MIKFLKLIPQNINTYFIQLNKDVVKFSDAGNDCCMHIASTQRTVPLEKIQDVELKVRQPR